MTKRKRFITFLIVVCTFFHIFSIPAYAMGDVAITGKYQNELTLVANKEYFSSQYLVGPGDYWSSVIEIRNDKNSKDMIDIRLSSVTSNIEDTTLFDLMDLKIIVGNKILYDGPYNGNPQTDYFTIKPDGSVELIVIMGLPDNVGNDAQAKVMDSMWLFETKSEKIDPPSYDDDYDDRVKYYKYTVKYEDEHGNELHKDKVGKAPYGNTLTEYAIEIDGYIPLEEKLKIKITRHEKENVIVFIYKENSNNDDDEDDPVVPDIPDEPDKPEENDPSIEPNPPSEDKPKPDDTNNEPSDNTPDDNQPKDEDKNVVTGNEREIQRWLTIIIGSTILLVIFIIMKKKNKKDDEEDENKE